ncbi:MAG: YezD family protein [Candidatus Omnitrophica bacterium]|nr:YezD family protein [Candidatus Omnitrophota bacterium]MBI5144573.1 YezD family protein [Candidatus Omnitrophota bacterium]
MTLKENQRNIVNDAIVKELIEAVNSLDYGYVHITVHNSKIVQIDKTKKTRFDDVWLIEKGGEV